MQNVLYPKQKQCLETEIPGQCGLCRDDSSITLCYAYTAPLELMKIPNLSAVNRSAEIHEADQARVRFYKMSPLSLYTTKTI